MKLIKYMTRWQLSTPILAIVPYFLMGYDISNFWITAIISNIIGSLIFYKVDEYIFQSVKAIDYQAKYYELSEIHDNLQDEYLVHLTKELNKLKDETSI